MAQFIISAFADEASDHLSEQIKALKRNGLSCIEPRSMDGSVVLKTDAELQEIRKSLDAAGIGISALGSPCGKYDITKDFEPHLVDFRRALEVCKILGTNKMRMFSFFVPEDQLAQYRDEVIARLRVMLDEAKKAGITLCHENEYAIYGQNPSEVRDLLTTFPEMRGVFDAANFVRHGQDALEGFEATLPSLEYLHIKDARAEDQMMTPAGLGDGHYEEILRRVDTATDRTVYLTVEPHLFVFKAFKTIDLQTLEVGVPFETADEAFDTAVNALKHLLTKIGFHEEENHVWKK